MSRYSPLKCFYDVEKTIGTGGFAKVKLATHLLTGEKVAIKIMDKTLLGDDYPRVKLELEALKSISHHHICKLYQVIETATHFYLVMEYCSGGELFDHIVEKNRLTEAESRAFFRQIVSAVAYLHSVGYAHRDLKPENVLLDDDLNLKLIDFGLCAKPKGGMKAQLQTSCGSPTYAAPELIEGQKYLGSEVDIWSMGVLLYALLCGYLPFDCESIEGLYKKILSGKYEEPPWLNVGSRQIIRQMLQVDPKERITVNELLSHPWITRGYYEPVDFNTLHQFHEKNEAVINVMAEHYSMSPEEMWTRLDQWSYDYDTATYMLLLQKHKLRQPLKLNSAVFRKQKTPGPLKTSTKIRLHSPDRAPRVMDMVPKGYTTPVKTRKRTHIPEGDEENSPVPTKRTPGKRSLYGSTSMFQSPTTSHQPVTPGNRIMDSIEKKLTKVRNVLTPRKRQTHPIQPQILTTKNLCNVSTTSSKNPDQVLRDLTNSFNQIGIECSTKGYTLRGKIQEVNQNNKHLKLFFELEIVLINKNTDSSSSSSSTDDKVIGIKRKRLKGDSWCYKKVCEQILRLTS